MVERFVNECVAAVRAIADAPAAPPGAAKPTEVGDPVGDAPYPAPSPSPARPATAQDRFEFFEGARLAVGRTALCLSGGGALAMYHMGVVKALLEAGVMPRIVSGTSGGAIIAGLLALHTDREMLDHVISPDITDRYGVPWFDPLPTQVRTFASSLLTADRPYIMSSERFARACRSCFGKTTFADAFRRTGRVVSIVITVRYGSGGGGASSTHPFLVNYLTCPNVYVWSAVAASCALPGLMPAANLLARPHTAATPPPPPTPGPSPRDTPGGDDADGSSDGPSCDPSPPAPGSDAASSAPDEVPFHPRGVDSLDGSMQSDIPCDALARMFHVNRFVTSQVNPHVAPFLREDHHSPSLPPAPSTAGSPDADGSAAASASLPGPGARPGVASLLSQIRLWLTLDVQYRTRRLARMQLLPRFFGADLSGVFTQRYRGHVTISPHMTLFDQCKALSHPSREDMARYIRQGELATWPKLAHIRTLVAAEKELSRAVRAMRPLAVAEAARARRGRRPGQAAEAGAGPGRDEAGAGPSEARRRVRSRSGPIQPWPEDGSDGTSSGGGGGGVLRLPPDDASPVVPGAGMPGPGRLGCSPTGLDAAGTVDERRQEGPVRGWDEGAYRPRWGGRTQREGARGRSPGGGGGSGGVGVRAGSNPRRAGAGQAPSWGRREPERWSGAAHRATASDSGRDGWAAPERREPAGRRRREDDDEHRHGSPAGGDGGGGGGASGQRLRHSGGYVTPPMPQEHSPPHHRLPPSRDSTDRGGSRHHTPGRTPARAGRRQPDRDLGGSLGAWGGALLEQVEEEAAAASPGLHVDGMVAMPADGFVTPAAVSESGGPGDGEDEEEEGGAAARGGARPTHRDWRSSLGPHMVTALRLSPGGRAELRRSQAAMAAEEAALTHRPRAVTQG